MQNLGTLGGDYNYDSSATGINNIGQVVGYSRDSNYRSRAFIYDISNGMKDLGSLGGNSYARSINNVGQVVGESYDINGLRRGFIYDSSNGMRDINSFVEPADLNGWILSFASGINDVGDIVGFAYKQNIGYQAFVLSVKDEISAVPIPAAAWLFAPALLGFIGLRRKVKTA
jgi:probable HAF family extracellular repeat protein